MKLASLFVDNLYGYYNYEVKFNSDVTFLFGSNGCGNRRAMLSEDNQDEFFIRRNMRMRSDYPDESITEPTVTGFANDTNRKFNLQCFYENQHKYFNNK